MSMSDQEFWEAIGIEPPETPTLAPSTEWDDWFRDLPEIKPTPVTAPKAPAKMPTVQAKKENNSSALTKVMAVVIIILVILLGVTAYQNHRLEKTISEASAIIASASSEAESIKDDADEKAKEKIAEAEAEAKNIKEETE